MKKIYFLLCLSLLLFMRVFAADTVRIRIGSVDLCPGEVKDIPIYIDGVTAEKPLSSIQFNLYVSDSAIFELVTTYWDSVRQMGNPVMTEVDPALARLGPMAYNYVNTMNERTNLYVPRFLYSWYDGTTETPTYIPQKDLPIFKLRIRSKKKGKAYLTLVPKSGSLYNGVGTGPLVTKFVVESDTAWITNSNDPVVSAGGDHTFCVNTKHQILGANGGVAYQWKAYGPSVKLDPEALKGCNLPNPIFQASRGGMAYTYEVKISDARGCYSLDTVRYFVSKNNTRVYVGSDTLIDMGGQINLQAEAGRYACTDNPQSKPYPYKCENDHTPYTISWIPDTLVLHPHAMQSLTKPLFDPVLLKATVTDTNGCQSSSLKIFHIRGQEFSGTITPAQVYHCGEKNFVDQSVALQVLVKGGNGHFSYLWEAKGLESGTEVLPPMYGWIEGDEEQYQGTGPNTPTTLLHFYGQTAYSITVTDEDTKEQFTVHDTVILLPTRKLESILVLADTQALCEGQEVKVRAQIKNGGTQPLIRWMINSKVVSTGTDTLYAFTNVKMGDALSYEVNAQSLCPNKRIDTSNVEVPALSSWIYPAVRIEDTLYKTCGDSAHFIAYISNGGYQFDLSFLLNNKKVLNSHTYHVQNPTEAKVEFVYNPSNYYDFVSCMIHNSTAKCKIFDSTTSGAMYPLVQPLEALKVGRIISTHISDTICQHTKFKLSVDEIRNLGAAKDLVVRWMCQAKGDAVATEIKRFSYPDANHTARADLKAGFPIIFNIPNGNILHDGDSIYALFESRNPCFGTDPQHPEMGIRTTDSTPKIGFHVFPIGTAAVQITNPLETDGFICMGDSLLFHANPDYAGQDVSYQWVRNRLRLPGATQNQITLANFSKKDTVFCEINTKFACVSGYPIRKKAIPVEIREVQSTLSVDTSVCLNEIVPLHATGGLTYAWSPALGLDDSTLAKPMAKPLTSQTYIVKIQDTNACVHIDSVYIEVIPLDAHASIQLQANKTILCKEEPVQFTASLQYADSIAWFVNNQFVKGHSTLHVAGFSQKKSFQSVNSSSQNDYGAKDPISKVQFEYTPKHGDTIHAVAHSNFKCVAFEMVSSPKIGIQRYTYPQNVEFCKDTLLCQGADLRLWVSDSMKYSYEWYSHTDQKILANTSQYIIKSELGAHKYSVKMYEYSEQCAFLDTLLVTTYAQEEPTSLRVQLSDTLLCTNKKVHFTATTTHADSLTWFVNNQVQKAVKVGETEGDKSFDYLPAHNDTVFARAYSSAFCARTSPATSPKVRIQKYEYPVLENVNEDTSLCYGQKIPLRASGAKHYQWIDTAGLPLLPVDTCCFDFEAVLGNSQLILKGYNHLACAVYDTLYVHTLAYQDSTLVRVHLVDTVSCRGQQVQLIAQTNQGRSLTWYVNGIAKKTKDFTSTASNSDTLFYTPHGNDSVHARLSSSYMCPRNTPALSPKVYIQNYAYPQLQKSKDTTLCIGVSTALYFEGTPFYRNFSHPNVPHEQKENRFVFATPTNLSEEIAEVLYSVEGYFHSACVTRDTIRVRYRPLTHSQLVFSISQDSLCLGSSFSFRAMGYPNLYYKWYVNGLEKGLTVNDANERLGSTWSYTPQIGDSIWVQQVLSPDLACGSYTLISSQKIKPNPVNLQIDLSADTTLCAGHPAQVWATTNALKFYWKPTATMLSPNQLSSLVWPQQTTAYIFSATLGACFSKDTLWVNVNPSPKVPLILDAWVCAHDSATAKALLGLQTPDTTCLYQWFTDTLAPSIHQGFSYQALPGIYFVSALNALHCASPFATGQVGVDAPVIAAFELNTPAFANTELSFVNYSENAQNWNWHFGDGLSSTLESPTHTYDSIGLYLVSLRATNQRQCFDTVSLAVDVRYNPQNYEESTVFIPSAFAPGASNIEDKVFKVYGPALKTVHIRVSNAQGSVVFQSSTLHAAWDGTFRGQACVAGTYFYEVVVQTTQGQTIRKLGNVTLIR